MPKDQSLEALKRAAVKPATLQSPGTAERQSTMGWYDEVYSKRFDIKDLKRFKAEDEENYRKIADEQNAKNGWASTRRRK